MAPYPRPADKGTLADARMSILLSPLWQIYKDFAKWGVVSSEFLTPWQSHGPRDNEEKASRDNEEKASHDNEEKTSRDNEEKASRDNEEKASRDNEEKI